MFFLVESVLAGVILGGFGWRMRGTGLRFTVLGCWSTILWAASLTSMGAIFAARIVEFIFATGVVKITSNFTDWGGKALSQLIDIDGIQLIITAP